MGAVYLARQLDLDRPVVVKIIAPEHARAPGVVERLHREARAAARMSSDFVVRVYETGVVQGVPFIAMEYVDGISASTLLERRGALRWDEATKLILATARGLKAAHDAGIFHRDVKPANILITRDGRVKVADFGLARFTSTDAVHGPAVLTPAVLGLPAGSAGTISVPGQILGTPEYMPPEQLHAKDVDARGDLYSLGVSYYQLLTGKLPFTGSTVHETIAKLLFSEPRRPRELVPDVPAPIEAACLRLMARMPDARPRDMSEAIELLRGLLSSGGDRLQVSSSSFKALPANESPAAASRPLPIGRVAAVVAVVAVMTVGIVAFASRSSTAPPPTPDPAQPSVSAASPSAPPGFAKAKPILAELAPAPGSTPMILPQPSIRLSGRLADPRSGPVYVGEAGKPPLEKPLDEQGRFEVSLGLEPDARSVEIRAGATRELLATVAVEIDVAPPEVELENPVWRAGLLEITGLVKDAHPRSASVSLFSGDRLLVPSIEVPAEGGRFSTSFAVSRDAPNLVLVVVGRDAAGHETSARREVEGTRVAPKIELEQPVEGTALRQDAVIVRARVKGGTAPVREAEVAVISSRGETVARFPLNGDLLEVSSLELPREDGPCRIEVRATDRSGGRSAASVGLVVDRTAPELSCELEPVVPGAPVARLVVRSNEPLASLCVDNAERIAGQPSPGPWTLEVQLDASGSAIVTITGVDAAGNVTRLEPRTIGHPKPGRAPAGPRLPGWTGELMPSGLRRGDNRGSYVYAARGIELDMVYVPPGDFTMGDEAGEPDERPVHTHALPNGFWIARTEVTRRQFHAWCREARRPVPPAPRFRVTDDHPIVNVTWYDAKAFCDALGLRLPSEAEWEKAARGTDGRSYPWGSDWSPSRANFCDGSCPDDIFGKDKKSRDGFPYTAPVGSFPSGASPCGALDMAGNVWEWCADYYDPDVYERYAKGRLDPPRAGSSRVRRGGSWNNTAKHCRAANRQDQSPGVADSATGFRPVKSADD
jgi:serine/threonine-protein kinase